MVQLRMCGSCQEGEHTKCERGQTTPGLFGGWVCTCTCRGRSDEQRKADDEAEFKEKMKNLQSWEKRN